MVSQPALHLAECPEDDDVEGGEDDDGAELGGDERVDAVEGGVVPAEYQDYSTKKGLDWFVLLPNKGRVSPVGGNIELNLNNMK